MQLVKRALILCALILGSISSPHLAEGATKPKLVVGGNRPVLTVKDYKQNRKCMVAKINGPSMVFDALTYGTTPLPCGARVWIETESEVEVMA